MTVRALKELYDPHCTWCELHKNAQHVCVPSSGSRSSFKALIVGEAPGRNEDEQNKPFVGRSGWLLDRELYRHNVGRDNIVVTNAVKCRPSSADGKYNQTPEYPEIDACVNAYLAHEIFLLDARVILAMGNVAAQALLDVTGIALLRGSWHALNTEVDRWVLVTYHPAYVLRQGLDSVTAQQFREDITEFLLKARQT